ncbi:hypothetical protein Tco_1230963 [Tanacetum coccineum]
MRHDNCSGTVTEAPPDHLSTEVNGGGQQWPTTVNGGRPPWTTAGPPPDHWSTVVDRQSTIMSTVGSTGQAATWHATSVATSAATSASTSAADVTEGILPSSKIRTPDLMVMALGPHMKPIALRKDFVIYT